MGRLPAGLIWLALACAVCVPIGAAAFSPLLAWRDPAYILAGFAGIAAMALMLLQPLLAAGYLPGVSAIRGRQIHLWTGTALIVAVVIHVGGLWITSPPDVVDVLLFRSPTPFGIWGALGMWALFLGALVAVLRRRWRLAPKVWRRAHTGLVLLAVVSTVAHALLIQGSMETASKTILSLLLLGATIKAIVDLRAWARKRTQQ